MVQWNFSSLILRVTLVIIDYTYACIRLKMLVKLFLHLYYEAKRFDFLIQEDQHVWHISRHLSWVKSTKNVSRITAHFLLTEYRVRIPEVVVQGPPLEYEYVMASYILNFWTKVHKKCLFNGGERRRNGSAFFDPLFNFHSTSTQLNGIWKEMEQKL